MGEDEPLAGLYEVWQIEELPAELVDDDAMRAKIDGDANASSDDEADDHLHGDAIASATTARGRQLSSNSEDSGV